MASEYYIGEGLKIQIDISAEGFDQENGEYTIDVYCNDEYVERHTKDEMRSDGEGHYLLPLPTDNIPEGKITLIVTAYIPDEDFSNYGGIRKVVAPPIKLGILKRL